MNLINWTSFAIIDFGIQLSAFVVSYALKTEYFYDVTGSVTYLIILGVTVFNKNLSLSQTIQCSLAAIWAIRLGSYLFFRMLKQGEDKRFRKIKNNAIKFFIMWNLQGLWILITLYPTLQMGMKSDILPIQFVNVLGWSIFAIGFTIETIADQQKWDFKADIKNKDTFITNGLWKYSRHPNYLGEILLWSGLCVSSFSHISSIPNRLIASMSTIFTSMLIIKITGIPILEKSADNRWGTRLDYQKYKKQTACLIPLIW